MVEDRLSSSQAAPTMACRRDRGIAHKIDTTTIWKEHYRTEWLESNYFCFICVSSVSIGKGTIWGKSFSDYYNTRSEYSPFSINYYYAQLYLCYNSLRMESSLGDQYLIYWKTKDRYQNRTNEYKVSMQVSRGSSFALVFQSRKWNTPVAMEEKEGKKVNILCASGMVRSLWAKTFGKSHEHHTVNIWRKNWTNFSQNTGEQSVPLSILVRTKTFIVARKLCVAIGFSSI